MKYCLLIFTLLLAQGIAAQQCEGNLGENIFTRGDFGSGSENIPNQDPQIAPGYSYVRTGPPQDGSYVITNNTGAWSGLFPSWLEITDNSSDPNGYMMVVNASLDPGIFYAETVDNLCENTLYEFSADVINLVSRATTNHTLPQVDFLLGDQVLFSTGPIAQTEQWNTYGFTFRTDPGATEINLSLRNNAPGGFGNDLALDNISFRACGPSAFIGIDTDQTIFLCEDENDPVTITADLGNSGFNIMWQTSNDLGTTWNDLPQETDEQISHSNFQPGEYRYRYLAAPTTANLQNFKCRTISDEITLRVLPLRYMITDSICAGLPYPFAGGFVMEAGVHEATLRSSRNCDSIVTLDLHHISDPDLTINFDATDPLCTGDSSGTLLIADGAGSQGPYSFFMETNSVLKDRVNQLPAGEYQLFIQDRYQCRDSVEINLVDPDPFEIDVGPDSNLVFGESISVEISTTQDLSNINWSPPDFLNCSDCELNTVTGIQTIEYLITSENNVGCEATDTLRIFVERGSLPLYSPNAFTPDGNGINDFFNLISPGQAVQVIERLLIFDRWGSQVFEGKDLSPNDPQSGWDGMISGQEASPGVYVFSASLRLIDNSVEMRSGTVTVIR